jgi:hypothetical protein
LADGPGGSVRECPGRDGVRVLLAADDTAWATPASATSDARRWMRLRVARDETDLMLAITDRATPGVAPRLASTPLEWRYRVDGAQRTLVALIMQVLDPAPVAGRAVAHWLVLRVTPDVTFCVVSTATTPPAARRLADGPTICNWIIPPREAS